MSKLPTEVDTALSVAAALTPTPLAIARERLENELTIGPADYSLLVGIGMPLVYRALHDGEIKVIKHGRHYRIPSAWVRAQLGL